MKNHPLIKMTAFDQWQKSSAMKLTVCKSSEAVSRVRNIQCLLYVHCSHRSAFVRWAV